MIRSFYDVISKDSIAKIRYDRDFLNSNRNNLL